MQQVHFGVQGLGGLGFRAPGLGFRVWGVWYGEVGPKESECAAFMQFSVSVFSGQCISPKSPVEQQGCNDFRNGTSNAVPRGSNPSIKEYTLNHIGVPIIT